jgi:hypothetical protein
MSPNFIRLDALEADTRDVLSPNTLARHCSLDNGRHISAFNGSTVPYLDILELLPAELQLQVILPLGIAILPV